MSNSNLTSYTKISPHKTNNRNHAIDTITIHCIVAQWTAKQGCDYFATQGAKCSANYVVGKDGSIGLSVEEKDRSWCTSNAANDHRAVTIEVASDSTHPYAVTDKALSALIDLVADICKRNGIKKLVWSTNKSDRVNHKNGCNMTVHCDYANKACPGEYLYSRHGYIAEQVNARLGSSAAAPVAPTEPVATSNSLTVGSTGSKVTALQNNLNGLGYNCGNADGSYGSKTKAAVIAFQKAYNIAQSGVADATTLAKIEEVVKTIQTKLNALGYSCGTVDGVYDSATKSAVTKFQSANKLVADGIAGEKTIAALNKSNTQSSYVVRVTASVLNIRKGPGASYAACGQIKDKGTYTITEVVGNWGKLKSGAGWICLDYTKRV